MAKSKTKRRDNRSHSSERNSDTPGNQSEPVIGQLAYDISTPGQPHTVALPQSDSTWMPSPSQAPSDVVPPAVSEVPTTPSAIPTVDQGTTRTVPVLRRDGSPLTRARGKSVPVVQSRRAGSLPPRTRSPIDGGSPVAEPPEKQ